MAKLVRLLALIAAAGMVFGSVGCKKEESAGDKVDQMMEEAEEGAEEAADEAEDAMDEMQ